MEIEMGQKEAKRLEVLVQVKEGAISNKEGPGGLISRRKGKPAKNRIAEAVRQTIRELIETQYAGYGPTLEKYESPPGYAGEPVEV